MEQQGYMGVYREFATLAAFKVGVENEPAFAICVRTMALEQNHPHRRMAICICRRQCHGIAVIEFTFARLFEPGIENYIGILAFHIAPIG